MRMRAMAWSRRRGVADSSACSRPAREARLPLVRPVAGLGVGLEVGAAGEAARKAAVVEVGQEVAVGGGREVGDVGGVLLGDGPADVVVAAQIGGEARAAEAFGEVVAQDVAHQARVAGGERRPELDHEVVVVGEVRDAPLVPALAEIGDEVAGAHDGLGLVEDAGGRGAGGLDQGLEDVVHLGRFWQVVPVRFHRKATASRRNTSTPLLARTGCVDEGQEDLRVLPVQVPLVFVEGGPDPFPESG
jgi:hypothetical protein